MPCDPTADHQFVTGVSYVNLPTITLSTQMSLCTMWTLPSHAIRGFSQWVWCGGCWPRKFCTCVAPFPMNNHRRSHLISTSTETPKRLEKKRRWLLKRLWPRRHLGVNGLLSSWVHCCSAWVHRQLWRGAGALWAHLTVFYSRLEHSACR